MDRKRIFNKAKKNKKDKPKNDEKNILMQADSWKDMSLDDRRKYSIDNAMKMGLDAWDFVKDMARQSDYANMSDDKRVDALMLKCKDFYQTFPVVSRYMVCMGQFSPRAFNRYLEKRHRSKPSPNADQAEKADQLIRCQASYLQYLWESMQKHVDTNRSKEIYQHSYKMLKEEVDKFKKQEKKIRFQLEKEKKEANVEKIVSMTDKIKNDPNLMKRLQVIMYKKHHRVVMNELLTRARQNQLNADRAKKDEIIALKKAKINAKKREKRREKTSIKN
jgi:hypothetical protein